MGKKYQVTHRVHNIDFHRIGECTKCGDCCAIDESDCPHFDWDLRVCKIYDKLGEVCQECTEARGKTITHAVCRDYPNHPFLYRIMGKSNKTNEPHPQCPGFKFIRLNENREQTLEPLPFNADPTDKQWR